MGRSKDKAGFAADAGLGNAHQPSRSLNELRTQNRRRPPIYDGREFPRLESMRLGENVMDAEGVGIRSAFRIPIVVLVVIALFAVSLLSYLTVSASELERAGNSMRSEVNYLCLQLKSLGERSEAFARIVAASGAAAETANADPADRHLLSDPVGDILSGYTLAETGTVAIASDGIVVTSADERLPVGANLEDALGEAAMEAIAASAKDDELRKITFEGALSPVKPGDDAEGYLLARQQGAYTVIVVEPSGMVYRDRESIMIRETGISLIVLVVALLVLDRLLVYMVARRIDKTNEALGLVTAGNLDARVDEAGTREFQSLARGINITVDALQGWIAEAESRMDAELATAKAIQEATLPRTFPPFPDIPRFDLYASMDPAREVGGDFYDFFLVGEGCTPEAGKLGFVVADVSGKGVPAALFMMKAKALICDYVGSGADLGEAVTEANRSICQGNDAGMFVTAWIGVLDYATGHLDYVNAGHNPPLMRRDGSWRWLRDISGIPLGLFDVEYDVLSADCGPGDAILLYTDGVTEAYDAEGALYGEDRLLALVEGADASSPRDIQRLVRDDVAAHAQGAEQSDDITIMVVESSEDPR